MKNYTEISKNDASKAFNNGQSVYIVPCLQNVNVSNIRIDKNGLFQDFNTYCDFITYYNCDETMGKTIKFYL